MKIIEALKEIPLIEKRINKNCEDIQKYASFCNKIGPSFKDKDEQSKQVSALVQSNIDLVNRRLHLKRTLNNTNSTLLLKIEETELTVVEWLEYKNKMGELLKKTYNCLNINQGAGEASKPGNIQTADLEKAIVERCFDEKTRISGLEKTQNVLDKITGALEVFNATTDLVEA